jgi:hypothetical protein
VLRSSNAVLLTVECYGVSLAIECPASEVTAITARLPLHSDAITESALTHRFALEPSNSKDMYRVRRGRSWKAPPQPLDIALQTLEKQLHLCVAEHSMTRVFIHAGVVDMDGSTIVLPGFSHSGKSSLIWALVQAGAVYYSDEYAVIDEQGFIHPFGLPLHLRMPGGGRQFIIPNSVGSVAVVPHVIAFTRYRRNALWQPRALRPSETMLQLLRHSIGIRRNPSFILPVLRKVSLHARGFMGLRGETADTLRWIQETVKNANYAPTIL